MSSSFSGFPPDSPPAVYVAPPTPHRVGSFLVHPPPFLQSHFPTHHPPIPQFQDSTASTGAQNISNECSFNPIEPYPHSPSPPHTINKAPARGIALPIVGENFAYVERPRSGNLQPFHTFHSYGESVPPATTVFNANGASYPPPPLYLLQNCSGNASQSSGGFSGTRIPRPPRDGYQPRQEYGYQNAPPPPHSQQPVQHEGLSGYLADPEGEEPDRFEEHQVAPKRIKGTSMSTGWGMNEGRMNYTSTLRSNALGNSHKGQVGLSERGRGMQTESQAHIQTAGAGQIQNSVEANQQFYQNISDSGKVTFDRARDNNLHQNFYELNAKDKEKRGGKVHGWPRSYEADDRMREAGGSSQTSRKLGVPSSNMVHWKPSPTNASQDHEAPEFFTRNPRDGNACAQQGLNSQGFQQFPPPPQHYQGDRDPRGMRMGYNDAPKNYINRPSRPRAPSPTPYPPQFEQASQNHVNQLSMLTTYLQLKLRQSQVASREADEAAQPFNQPDSSGLEGYTGFGSPAFPRGWENNRRMSGGGVLEAEVSQSTSASTKLRDDAEATAKRAWVQRFIEGMNEEESRDVQSKAPNLARLLETPCLDGINRSCAILPDSNMDNIEENNVQGTTVGYGGRRFGNVIYQDGVGVGQRDQNGNIIHDDIDIEVGGGNSNGGNFVGGVAMPEADVEYEEITISDTDDEDDNM